MLLEPLTPKPCRLKGTCNSGAENEDYAVTVRPPSLYLLEFRAEKCNKHARVLGTGQAPSLKKWRNFFDRVNKRIYKLYMLSQFRSFPGKQQHVNVSNGSWRIVFVGN